ncbi:zf-HC2 domain-containing protein, partial [Micromonospora chalcea]
MACEQWREILSAQLDGEASRSEIEAAEAHLTGCAGCRGWFDSAAAVTRRAGVPAEHLEAMLEAATAPGNR